MSEWKGHRKDGKEKRQEKKHEKTQEARQRKTQNKTEDKTQEKKEPEKADEFKTLFNGSNYSTLVSASSKHAAAKPSFSPTAKLSDASDLALGNLGESAFNQLVEVARRRRLTVGDILTLITKGTEGYALGSAKALNLSSVSPSVKAAAALFGLVTSLAASYATQKLQQHNVDGKHKQDGEREGGNRLENNTKDDQTQVDYTRVVTSALVAAFPAALPSVPGFYAATFASTIEAIKSGYEYFTQSLDADGNLKTDGYAFTENVTTTAASVTTFMTVQAGTYSLMTSLAAGGSISSALSAAGSAIAATFGAASTTVAASATAGAAAATGTGLMASGAIAFGAAFIAAAVTFGVGWGLSRLWGWWRTAREESELEYLSRVLDIDPTCGQDDFRRRVRELLLTYHPDKQGGSNAEFIFIKTKIDRLTELRVKEGLRKESDQTSNTALKKMISFYKWVRTQLKSFTNSPSSPLPSVTAIESAFRDVSPPTETDDDALPSHYDADSVD